MQRTLLILILAAVAITIVTGSILYDMLRNSKTFNMLRIAVSADITTIDIARATAVQDFEVLGRVFESLFRIIYDNKKNRLEYIPWLIEEYRQINETFWIFKLKNNIRFHNGRRLTAYDVNASIIRAVKVGGIPKMLLTDAEGMPVIERMVIYNETALGIKLRIPFAPLIEHLAHLSLAVMPKEIAEKYINDVIANISDVVGTGPYRIVGWSRGQEIRLLRFDNYWRGRPRIEEIIYMVIRDVGARITALKAGQVDIAVGIPPEFVDQLTGEGFNIVKVPSVRHVIVAINTQRIPDAKIRCAFNYAVDRKALVNDVLVKAATISESVVSTVFPGIRPLKPFDFNPDKALELLSEAGSINRTLTLLVSTRSPKDVEVAEVVRYYLERAEIKVEVVPMEHAAFLKKVFTEHDFDLALYGPSPSSAYYGLTYWRTGSYLNGPQYSNPEVDRLLDKAPQIYDDKERFEVYNKIQEMIWRDCPAIWLYYEQIIAATKPDVKDLVVTPFQMLQLDKLIGLEGLRD